MVANFSAPEPLTAAHDVSPFACGRTLVVHALDAQAEAYWLRRGFLPSKDDPGALFRSIADIQATLVAAGRLDRGPE